MSEDYKVQVSLSLPPVGQYAKGHMVNFRGNTAAEVEALLDEALNENFFEKAALAGATFLAACGLVAPTPEPDAKGSPEQDSGNVTSITTKFCDHGKRNYRKGTNKQGKPYEGWFCPSSGKDECKPIWADKD